MTLKYVIYFVQEITRTHINNTDNPTEILPKWQELGYLITYLLTYRQADIVI